MRLMKWYPGANLPMLQEEMEDLFNNLFLINRRRVDLEAGSWVPKVNVREDEKTYELTAEIPGMEKDEINIEVQEKVLTIRGEKKQETEKKDDRYHICERSVGKFERTFRLPENVKLDKVDAEYKNGILTIAIPKAEEAKPREIEVKIR